MELTTFILFCSGLCSILMVSAANDIITAKQSMADGETIISAHGEFEMGFFSPRGRPQNRYFGIWYRKISTGTVVWVANRDNPIANTSGIIKMGSRGIIVTTNESTGTIVWSSNHIESVKNPVAQLLDTGNLVLRDENQSGGDDFIWQSFDFPVDNILPGMKVGVDLVSGIDMYFTPWTSDDDPSPGNFIYRLDPEGFPQLLLWKNSVLWYRTGPWVGSTSSGIPTLKPNGVYTSKYVITQKEIYYTTNLINTSESVITRFILPPSGDMQRVMWNKQKQEWTVYLTLQVSDCDRYGYCGTYGVCNANKYPRCECMRGFTPKIPEDWAAADWSNGCVRSTQLKCGDEDGFIKYSGVKLPDTRWSWYNTSMNLDKCEIECLKNCNCTAYSNTDVTNGGSGCMLWFGGLVDIRGYSEDAEYIYVRMAASELRNTSSPQKKRVLVILISVFAATSVITGLLLSYAFKKRWLKRTEVMRLTERRDLDLPLFDFTCIANATNNFSNYNKLGEGGFGTVYKGSLEEGQEIAVKRLSKDSRQGVDEFMNEVSCIAKLQHRNLVRLLGCCIEKGERLLIYEYMANKSLDYFIFDKEMCKSFDFDWLKRYNIIKGIAKGLLYLHHDSRLRIIHRDLKTSNILLDYELNPKISDFGLARIFGESETQASTTRVVGT